LRQLRVPIADERQLSPADIGHARGSFGLEKWIKQ
jgi:hypothetical protein